MKNGILLLCFAFCLQLLSAQCTDPFFSEYVEGSSNNKAYEIYNPSPDTLDLSNYRVELYNNGGLTASSVLVPQGDLLPGQVYVVANPTADTTILNQADTISNTTQFNGNDALILLDISDTLNIDTLDAIGIIGDNPGTNGWSVGTGFTKENTLVRKIGIQQGSGTNWAVGATEWDVYAQNTFTFLGTHNMTSCSGGSGPLLGFSAATVMAPESVGSVTVTVRISNADLFNATSVEVTFSAATSTATNGADFTYAFPDTLVWPAGDSTDRTLVIPITDDLLVEGSETIRLELMNASSGVTMTNPVYTFFIVDNDIFDYSIGQVTGVDGSGLPDSLGVRCRLKGIVYGVDLNGSAPLQFTLIDSTGGIAVFAFNQVNGYVVNEGDSIGVLGDITHFNGLTQIEIDSLEFYSSGNPLQTPTLVTGLDESTESELVRLDLMRIINPSQWTGTGSGFNVDITNGTDTLTMRIDNEVDLYSQSAPTVNFHVCGIGGQFDSSSPYTEGYQLLPRYAADLKLLPAAPNPNLGPDVELCGGDSVTLDAGAFPGSVYAWNTGDSTQTLRVGPGSYTVTDTIGQTGQDQITVTLLPPPVAGFSCDSTNAPSYVFTSTSTDATAYSWNFGDGTTSTLTNPTHTFTDGIWTVTLIVTNVCGADTTSKTVEYVTGMEERGDRAFQLFPNPSTGTFFLNWTTDLRPGRVEVVNLAGKRMWQANEEVVRNATNLKIEMGSLPAGVYLLKFYTAKGTLCRKLLLKN